MKHGSRFRGSHRSSNDADLDGALDAMTAGELLDSLIAHASKGSSGWKPSGPSRGVVGEVKRFVGAARRVGYADPYEVDDYLRKGTKAFLAGEHATSRGVFEALFPAISYGDVDLGQHELVGEVLTVDVHECAAQYVAAVYLTTPIEDRAEALCGTIDAVQEVAILWEPLEQMERVATGPLPELDAFLPRWVEHLERQSPSESEWDDDRDRWLRESHWQGEFLRWLGTGTPSASTVVQRAKKAIEHCPGQAGRQLGLLHLLRGDVQAASQVLARARGLGWSAEGHPGHLLFPAFAGLLAQGTETQLVVRLFADLRYVSRDPSDMDREEDDGANPRLAAPSVTALIDRSRVAARIDARGHVAMLKAMQAAARKRVAGILGNKRRRHYDHAAILVACCLELDSVAGKPGAIAKWVADLRRKYSRFPAFQRELDRALTEVSS